MEKQTEWIRKISLAAMLHDCGKIVHRVGGSQKNHSILGKEFVEPYCSGQEGNVLLEAIAYHHGAALAKANLPSKSIAYLIYEADNIAAGTDRRRDEGGEESKRFDKAIPLESIFNQLKGKCPENKKRYHYLRGLIEHEKINYGIAKKEATVRASTDVYSNILNTLKENFRKVDFQSVSPAEMLKIMEATCSFVPSSTALDEACDISLYDHVKLTAAIANAMYLYFSEQGLSNYRQLCFDQKALEIRTKDMFLLVSGDLSGIQNFIYTIASTGALKSLRGRSFYLDMVLEHIVDEILTALGLNRCNLIYTGGGHFYLLAPNTTETKHILDAMKIRCNEWFLSHIGTTLYLEMGYEPCCAANFMEESNAENNQNAFRGKTGEVFRRLGERLSRQKLQRYETDQLAAMFNPDSPLNQTINGKRECGICHTSTEKVSSLNEGSDTQVCSLCGSLYRFGRKILEEGIVFAVAADAQGLPLPCFSEETLSLHAKREMELAEIFQAGKLRRVYTKNEMKTGSFIGTNLWVGDYADRQDEQVADFESLARASRGIQRLGILRADVDYLGQTFATSFRSEDGGAHYLTLSRMATLSRQMSLFFKKYMNYICAGHIEGENEQAKAIFSLWDSNKEKRKAAIVYSGGDDIFMVGAWDDLLEFSVDLYQALQRFSDGKIKISAGLAILQHNYPISQMANVAGTLESFAKEQGRNRIVLLSAEPGLAAEGPVGKIEHCYEWPVFVEKVVGEKMAFLMKHLVFTEEENVAPIGRGHLKIGKGQLYKLIYFLRMKLAAQAGEQQNRQARMNIARFIYWLARLDPGSAADPEAKEDYRQLREQLYCWIADSKDLSDSRELLTALTLIIYGIRERNE